MADRKRKRQPPKPIRAECPGCACGYVGHMTADELKKRAALENIDLACPACGLIHLDREEIEELEKQRVVDSPRYLAIRKEAEALK
ncbi:MAG: hypothetical protein CSB34_02295 [Desulfobulbus propionicus]|nr:MAG: hypothetical protein CSB34_02295 [Desulfobulbus propionicus]